MLYSRICRQLFLELGTLCSSADQASRDSVEEARCSGLTYNDAGNGICNRENSRVGLHDNMDDHIYPSCNDSQIHDLA